MRQARRKDAGLHQRRDRHLDADPGTGFLVGETQRFADGTYFDQYRIGGTSVSSTLFDTVPGPLQDQARVDVANSTTAKRGFVYSARLIDYPGPESHCPGTGGCTSRDVDLPVRAGYDDMTGLGAPSSGFVAALADG